MTRTPRPHRHFRVERLGASDRELARQLFALMADVFGEKHRPLSDTGLAQLLGRPDFWALAAFADDGRLAGGLSAHTLPTAREPGVELFLYDIAVRPVHQRHGVGRQLLSSLREMAAQAGIHDLFVAADNQDTHALDFYRAMSGRASAVTVFEWDAASGSAAQ